MAAIRRPQLGSLPAQAVLTRGDCAMAVAMRRASASVAAPANIEFDEVRGAFRIGNDLFCQRDADFAEGGGKWARVAHC